MARTGSRKNTTEEYLKQVRNIHKDKYIYSDVVYTGSKNKISIICPKHGVFLQTAGLHLMGGGCRKCGRDSNRKIRRKPFYKFVEDASYIHKNLYTYDENSYINSKTKCKITCVKHGEFWQEPIAHLIGKGGCPGCKSENSIYNYKQRCYKEPFGDRQGCFYILKLSLNGEVFGKIGVSVNYKLRLGSYKTEGLSIHEIDHWIMSAKHSAEIESILLEYINKEQLQYFPKTNFAGKTECFNLCYLNEIVQAFHLNYPIKRCEYETDFVEYDEIFDPLDTSCYNTCSYEDYHLSFLTLAELLHLKLL